MSDLFLERRMATLHAIDTIGTVAPTAHAQIRRREDGLLVGEVSVYGRGPVPTVLFDPRTRRFKVAHHGSNLRSACFATNEILSFLGILSFAFDNLLKIRHVGGKVETIAETFDRSPWYEG